MLYWAVVKYSRGDCYEKTDHKARVVTPQKIIENGVVGFDCGVIDRVGRDRHSFTVSTSTADRLLRVMHLNAKISLPDCSKMLPLTLSRAMGYGDRGALEIGKRANIILLDEKMNINKIFFKRIEYAT